MNQPTSDAACAASVLFNLSDYEVLDVRRGEGDGHRTVVVATTATEAACPGCGVLTALVHQRTRQRLRDVPFDGVVSVVWVKKRWRCAESACARRSFTEHTVQVPPRARTTLRLREALVQAVAGEVRALGRVATQFAVSWPTVMRHLRIAMAAVTAAAACRPRLVAWLGISDAQGAPLRPPSAGSATPTPPTGSGGGPSRGWRAWWT